MLGDSPPAGEGPEHAVARVSSSGALVLQIVRPPSTSRTTPVMRLASSEAR
jgi:hypothetical protein